MKGLYLLLIIFIAVLFISGCVEEEKDNGEELEMSITLENLSDFENDIKTIDPENPNGLSED